MDDKYKIFLKKFEEINMIGTLESVLSWDTETTLPITGLDHRTKQYQYLSQKKHKLWINDKFGKLIEELSKNDDLGEIEKRNVELARREYRSRVKLPIELVSNLSSQSKRTNEIWKQAKERDQFSLVLPDLKKLFELNLEKANILAELKGMNDPYEALVTERDPGFTVDRLSAIFNEAKSFMSPLARKCGEKGLDIDLTFLDRPVSKKIQVKLAENIALFFKFKADGKDHAVVGEVEHPLTIAPGPKDARITVKYEHFEKVIFSSAHEVGHALHRLNYNPQWDGQPVNSFGYPSLGESSSRYTENKIGRSYEFWEFFFPKFQEITVGQFKDIDLDTFYSAINRVEPGPRRMKADEVTYGLHIIIRFEIERDLFAGKIELNELPSIWKEKYHQYLGVDVKNDVEGVMQDLHWYNVYWGYFQGYHLGDVMNSQIHETMIKSIPDWKDDIKNGNFDKINDYFVKNVYSKGALFDPLDSIKEITGEPLSTNYLKNYLENKYSKIYGL